MKRNIRILFTVSVAVLLVAGSLSLRGAKAEALPQSQTQQSNDPVRTVQVYGVAERQVTPDRVVIRLGVQTEAETAQTALDQNSTEMQALINRLQEANISTEDIQTQTVHLSPRYDFDNTGNDRTLAGYTAYNVVEVRTENLESLGNLLDQSVESGANIIESIRFDVVNSDIFTNQLRETAVQDARQKAEELAELTGATLGPILEIQESTMNPEPIPPGVEARTDAAAVPVLPGSQTIRVQVQMTWTLNIEPE
jgi:uncharacterized protein YggE